MTQMNVGKIAMRVRGDYVFVFYMFESKEVEILRIPDYVMQANQGTEIRDMALAIGRAALTDIIRIAVGDEGELVWPDGVEPAPANEREQ